MVAPGAYAILAPLFVGFFVGPRCLMGVNAGAIASGCMMAIMMSNAGGAWDNGKKLCEKLKIKKTDQGKACIVGDTVRRHARRRVSRARFCPSLSRLKAQARYITSRPSRSATRSRTRRGPRSTSSSSS